MSLPSSCFRQHTHLCDTCDTTLTSELELFDHKLTWNHRVQVDTIKNLSHKVSPPAYSGKSSRSRSRRRRPSRPLYCPPHTHRSSCLPPHSRVLEPPNQPSLHHYNHISRHQGYRRYMSHPKPPLPHRDYADGPQMSEYDTPFHRPSSRKHSVSSVESYDSSQSTELRRLSDSTRPLSPPRRKERESSSSSTQRHKSRRPSKAVDNSHRKHQKEIVRPTQPAFVPPKKSSHKSSSQGHGDTQARTSVGLALGNAPTDSALASSEPLYIVLDTTPDNEHSSGATINATTPTTDLATPTGDTSLPITDTTVANTAHRLPLVNYTIQTVKETSTTTTATVPLPSKSITSIAENPKPPAIIPSQLPTNPTVHVTQPVNSHSPKRKRSVATSLKSTKRTKFYRSPGGKLPAVPLIEVEPRLPSSFSEHLSSHLDLLQGSTPTPPDLATAQALSQSVLQKLTKSLLATGSGVSPTPTPPQTSPPSIVKTLLTPRTLLHLSGVSLSASFAEMVANGDRESGDRCSASLLATSTSLPPSPIPTLHSSTSLSPSPTQTLPSSIMKSLLTPHTLLHLSGVSLPLTRTGMVASSNELVCNTGGVSEQTANHSSSSSKTIIVSSSMASSTTMADTSNGRPVLQGAEKSAMVTVKTEPEDSSSSQGDSPTGTGCPPWELPPAMPGTPEPAPSVCHPPHGEPVSSGVSITTVSESRAMPILFGDVSHVGPHTFVDKDGGVSVGQDVDSPTLAPETSQTPVSLPRQPERGTVTDDLPADEGVRNDNARQHKQRKKRKRARSDNGREDSAKRARDADIDSTSGSSDILGQIRSLNVKETIVQTELFAVRKKKEEIDKIRQKQKARRDAWMSKWDELKARLAQLQKELKDAESVLHKKEHKLGVSEKKLSKLTERENQLANTFSAILTKKQELVLSSTSTAPLSANPNELQHVHTYTVSEATPSVTSEISTVTTPTTTRVTTTTSVVTPISTGSMTTPTSTGSASTPISTNSEATPTSTDSVDTPISTGSTATPTSTDSEATPTSTSLAARPDRPMKKGCALSCTGVDISNESGQGLSSEVAMDDATDQAVKPTPTTVPESKPWPETLPMTDHKKTISHTPSNIGSSNLLFGKQCDQRSTRTLLDGKNSNETVTPISVSSVGSDCTGVLVAGESPKRIHSDGMESKPEDMEKRVKSELHSSSATPLDHRGMRIGSVSNGTDSIDSVSNGDAKGGECLVYTPHQQPVLCLKTHGKYLFSSSSDNCVQIHNSLTGVLGYRLSCHEKAINSVAVFENKSILYLVTGSSDKHVHVYKVERSKQVARFSVGESVMGVVVSGDLLFIALLTGSVRIVDLSVNKPLMGSQPCHKVRISHFCVVDHYLITGSFDNTVCVWDTRDVIANKSNLTLVESISLPNTPLCVKVHDQYLIIGCGDANAYIYSIKDWSRVITLAHREPVTCVEVMGGVLITGSFDKLVRCFDIKTFKLLQLYCFESKIFCMCASNRMINVGLENGCIKGITLDLVNFHVCKWKDCGLKFGVQSDLTTYHLKDHVDAKEKLPSLCQWAECEQLLSPSELLAHLQQHADPMDK